MTTDTVNDFAALGLRGEILRAIDEAGYRTPTAIQSSAIPEVLAGRDVVGSAQTGTGKTASFVLPMLDILASGRARARMPRSLILSPTRELATQTARNFEIYGKHLSLSMALLIGGVGMGDQEKALDKGVDVLIATPGRMLDWFDRGKILLGGISILVIDEADRMLDMGFIPDVERIVQLLTGRKQTLLFSATMPKEVRRLADRFLNEPAEITVARESSLSDTVKDVLVPLNGTDKRDAVERLLKTGGIDKAIIFCNRKRDVGTLTRYMQKRGHNAKDLHGDLDQPQRQATLDAFKAGTVDLLVATDVAARGLDVVDMPCVINLDVPLHAEDYVHRIGRTGRAGRLGRAFTLAGEADQKLVAAIEKLTGRSIERLTLSEGAAGVAEGDASPARTGRRRRAAPNEAAPNEAAPNVEAAQADTAPASGPGAAPSEPESAPDPVVAAEPAPAEAPPRARKRRPAKAVDDDAAPDAPRRAAAPPRARRPSRRTAAAESVAANAGSPHRREEERSADEGPILAFGDHVPAFMLRRPPMLRPLKDAD
ncbi:MAG: DEAD/DEAH box helicase [Geminicoccaceae bacterium]|nr:DEAD/DEAH box helicase [Geminicoccaceae bacterium]